MPAVLLAAVLFIMASCRPDVPPREVVYSCAAYTVTSDSVITPRLRISASDLPVASDAGTGVMPEISFGGSALLTRLCGLGMSHLAAADTIDMLSTPANLCGLWLAGALISPSQSVGRLRAMLGADGLPQIESGGYEWPVAGGRGLWSVAALEAYCSGGDSLWLGEAMDVTDRMIALDLHVALRPDVGLLRGSVCVPDPAGQALYPRWADAVGRYESMALSVNAAAVGALQSQAAMHQISGRPADEALAQASAVASAVNDYLWMPHRSCYTQYIYGGAFPQQSPAIDNFGQALAMLFSIPTAEMAGALLAATPMTVGGPSPMVPSPVGTPPFNGSESWPTTQALWALAASRGGNPSAVAFTTAALIHDAAMGSDSGAASAALAVVALRVMAGITLSADAMEFHPVILPAFDGGMRVERLPYRDAMLTLDIRGSGSRIARFAIDGVETSDYRVSSSLSGPHTVEITLANNQLPIENIPTMPQAWLLPVPELDWTSPRSAKIVDPSPSMGYRVFINGVSGKEIQSPVVNIHRPDRFTSITVVAISDAREGYASKPHFFVPRGALTTLQAEEFAPGGTSLIKGPRLSRRFVETSATSRSSLVLQLPEPEPSDVLIDVCYANGSGKAEEGAACAIRSLTVNGAPCGNLIMPGRGDGWWLSTGYSNMLHARLDAGTNIIEIAADGVAADVTALIDNVRIFRLRKFPTPHEKNRTDK